MVCQVSPCSAPCPLVQSLAEVRGIPRWDRAMRRSADGFTMEWVVSDAIFLLIEYWKALPTVHIVLNFIISSWA